MSTPKQTTMYWYLLYRGGDDVVYAASDSEGVVLAERSRTAWDRVDAANVLSQIDLAGPYRARVCRISRAELEQRSGPPFQYTERVPRVPVSIFGQMIQGLDQAGLRIKDQAWGMEQWQRAFPLVGGA